MTGRAFRGALLNLPLSSANWACRLWSRNAFLDMVDLLSSSSDPTLHQEQKQKEKTIGNEALLGLPGFRGAERPSVADIHILCHVFQHIPWSPSVEKHLLRRNFGLTTHQVTLVLHKLKDNLTHTLNFFIWASQQRGHCHNAECFEILKNAMDVHIDHVHSVLKDMETNGRFIPLDVHILLMEVFAEKDMVQHALEGFQSITKFGSRPDEDAYNLILQILIDAGRIDVAFEIFGQMKKDKWCRPGATAFLLMLWGLGKAGKIAEARKLLGSLKSSHKISGIEAHSRLVDGLCEGGWMDQAEEAVIEMYELGFEPDIHVYTSLVSGHTKAGRLAEAHRYYVEAVKDRLITPSTNILTMLIAGFCKQDDVEIAHKLLREMLTTGLSPDASVYAEVIQCASKQGQWQIGQMLLDELTEKGISTNTETYNSVITSCVDAGQLDTALSLWCQMTGKDHICLKVATFSALFSRLIQCDRPADWQKLLHAIEGMEESFRTSLCEMLVNSLLNADKEVAGSVFKLMAERGLYQP
eukprot:c23660_g1_i1 orf=21-1598(+)